jgi:hypothetical protein
VENLANIDKDENMLTVGNFAKFTQLNEEIGQYLASKFRNIRGMDITRRRNVFSFRYGEFIRINDHISRKKDATMSFVKSDDPEGDIWELENEAHFSELNTVGNIGYFRIKDEEQLKIEGKFISELLELNGIKLSQLSKAKLENDQKTVLKLIFPELSNKNREQLRKDLKE